MTRNRLLLLGEQISFRLASAQVDRLRSHALVEGEPMAQIMNRQLRRLSRALRSRTKLAKPLLEGGGKGETLKLAPELERVQPFIHRMKKSLKMSSDRATVELLLPWSCSLPPVVALSSADEAHECWVEIFGAGASSIPIREALLAIDDRCSLESAKAWLYELKKSERVTLRISYATWMTDQVVRLPDGRGEPFCYLDLNA